ncbi:MAG TPA: AAA family ATPase, partial [Candidatus Binatia bacterium]|nr:AAA family ATPase [Candidatus Binatia bacterium]
MVLLDEVGRELQRFPSASALGQTRLVDVNGDQIDELMLASFGTIALTDPGTGARKNAQAWDYRLFAAPLSTLVADLNNDGEDELLIGTRDGQLHILESSNGQAGAIVNTGGEVSHLALLPSPSNEDETLVVAAHNHDADASRDNAALGYVELIQPSGRVVWPDPVTLPANVTGLVTGNVNRDGALEIVVGTADGQVIVYSSGGRELWRAAVDGAVQRLLLVEGDEAGQQQIVVSTSRNEIVRFDGGSNGEVLAYFNLHELQQLMPLPREEGSEQSFLLATDDGLLRTLTTGGAQPWQWQLAEGQVTHLIPAGEALVMATSTGSVLSMDVDDGDLLWQLQNLGQISALYWGDLDGGGTHDLAIGTRGGQILLHTSDARQWDSVNLSSNSSVFALAGVHRSPTQEAQLAVVTDNGVVQLYEAKPNRPPLLIDPHVDVGSGRYDVRVSVVEEQGDEVSVSLQTFDPELEEWRTAEQRTVVGRDNLLFPISTDSSSGLRYRFVYSDGTHEGVITPPIGPPGPALRPLRSVLFLPALVLMALFSVAVVVRQSFNVDARARRFYRRLQQEPKATLRLLEEQYRQMNGSPDFLLSVGNRARPDHNLPLINVVDGLFLLDGRPGAAIAILDSALKEAQETELPWDHLRRWRLAMALSHDLTEAPTVTELSLLRPQLVQLVQHYGSTPPVDSLQPFLPVLTNLRDSERVELAEDRIVYLHEALVLLCQMREGRNDHPRSIGAHIEELVEERLSGLVSAEIETLRGQAQLSATLKTKRVVPRDGRVTIALEIHNQGRAAARNVVVTLDRDAAYEIDGLTEEAAVLSPGRTMVAEFDLRPGVEDRFRAAFTIEYDDRSQKDRRLKFADMVHLLPPQRDFSPIANPYLPGTPLRGDSTLFYGREDLFDFIIENAGQLARRNVLILVGQRRTGKTSALLRLDRHLPSHLLPVYIDCQSLGVLPGMSALFHDLAWHIADALALRGHEVEVPAAACWRDDPARLFRHEFLPSVRSQLAPATMLLLVFDEFEAFENLVNDEILPPTFFTYMRHLMQHSDGLSFAFVGTRRLEEMTSNYWSVLFNIALYRQIGFLSKEATTKLITEPVAPDIV